MRDITLCINKLCEQRDDCLRARKPANTEYAWYSHFCHKECEHFIDIHAQNNEPNVKQSKTSTEV